MKKPPIISSKECEDDPQAAEFGWLIDKGWIPPEEARLYYRKVPELKVLSDREIKQLIQSDKKRVSGWIIGIAPRDRKIAQAQRDKDQRQIGEAK